MPIRVLPMAALALALGGCATASDDAASDAGLLRMLAGQSAVQGDGLARAVAAADRHPLGSMENPVRVEMPVGERAYLARLRCLDGTAPRYERQGSGGDSPYGNIIDYYALDCPGGATTQVIMDMYHPGHVEDRAVPGFTIVPR